MLFRSGYKNLYVENCEMDSPNLDRVIRIKTSNCRGGVIENVFVRNIKVGVVKNYSYAIVDGQVYYRENSRMVRPAPVSYPHLWRCPSRKKPAWIWTI